MPLQPAPITIFLGPVEEEETPRVVIGDGEDNLILGAAGDDFLIGQNGDDSLSGEAGDDNLSGDRGDDALDGGDGDDLLDGHNGDDSLSGGAGDDILSGGRGEDTLDGGAGNDIYDGGRGDDLLTDSAGDDNLFGGLGFDTFIAGDGTNLYDGGNGLDTVGFSQVAGPINASLELGVAITGGGQSTLVSIENLTGGAENDILIGNDRKNQLNGASGQDTLTGGQGADQFVFDGDPFDGGDVSAAGRQVVGGEDFITDFEFNRDAYAVNATDFGIEGDVSFVAVDANTGLDADGNAVSQQDLDDANVIVLLNSDNDDDPNTAFNAGVAANQIADLVDDSDAGLFVYFNSGLELNRLVYSTDLSDNTADLKIVSRQTDLLAGDAIDALGEFNAANFVFDDIII